MAEDGRSEIWIESLTILIGLAFDPEIVDAICCEFNKDLNDVIDSALEWANQEGRWQHRTGTVDCWPVGYATNKEKKEMCDEWSDCHPTKKKPMSTLSTQLR